MGNNMMQQNQMGVPTSTSEQSKQEDRTSSYE